LAKDEVLLVIYIGLGTFWQIDAMRRSWIGGQPGCGSLVMFG